MRPAVSQMTTWKSKVEENYRSFNLYLELRKQFELVIFSLVLVEIVAQWRHTFGRSLASTVLCWNSSPANSRSMYPTKLSAKNLNC